MTSNSSPLTEYFDAVIFLTWSDWKNEPRSNRYHYARRFSRELPVLFLQNQSSGFGRISIESTDIGNLDIVNVPLSLNQHDAIEIKHLLSSKGIKRPLVWIYDSVHYWPLLDALPLAFRVYHATEDYLTKSVAMQTGSEVTDSVRRLLPTIDLVVAVSEKVLEVYIKNGGYAGPSIVAENGCDYAYFKRLANHASLAPPSKQSVIYQGGINDRLDYELLLNVVNQMPEWTFHFCGKAVESEGWKKLRRNPNINYLGDVSPAVLGRAMLESTVGLIPFIQDDWIRNSLPLKSYEYISCHLPVVSVPIEALTPLASKPGIMTFAETPEQFVNSIQKVAATRFDQNIIRERDAVAFSASYDHRFAEVCDAIAAARKHLGEKRNKLNIAIFYDQASCLVGTVKEHLQAFDQYSANSVTLIPASNPWGVTGEIAGVGPIDLSIFDAIAIHYSIRLSRPYHFVANFANAVEQFHGLKILFIQDEYEGIEIARNWMDRLKFDLVYTCVPLDQRSLVYPDYRYPYTEFLPTLTGYIPDNPLINTFCKPISERTTYIGYRGRTLPSIYGKLGQEKFNIGIESKRCSDAAGLLVDISVDEQSRIYGDAWYAFLGSVRATLGTESGSNVFDFDGSLAQEINRLEKDNPDISFEEVWSRVLSEHEGKVRMNQISPKIFEAIRLRTALILFEGEYSGVVKADVHYIPLKKDFSNFNDVIAKLKDDAFIKNLTDRAYQDIIKSDEFSYESFIRSFDEDLRSRCFRTKSRQLLLGSILKLTDSGDVQQVLPVIPLALSFGQPTLGFPESFQSIVEKTALHSHALTSTRGFDPTYSLLVIRKLWHQLSPSVRSTVIFYCMYVLRKSYSITSRSNFLRQTSQKIYRSLPENVRLALSLYVGIR